MQIWTILHERVASPSELAAELGESLNRISHHIRVLKEAGCIEQCFERVVGGAVEHFYKATSPAFIDDSEWPEVPAPMRGSLRATLFENVTSDVVAALKAETYDSRDDSHMSWTPMILDEQGCEETAAILLRALQDILDVQKQSDERLLTKDVPGNSYTVSILGYPAAGGKRKVGPPSDANRLERRAKQQNEKP